MNTRTTGLLIALAFALITIGVVLFVYVRHASAPVAQPVAPTVAAEEQIQMLDTDVGPHRGGGEGRIQGTAEDDPERVVYDFTYERIDPRPKGEYDVESPSGWIYLEDGRSVHVRAERGKVIAPAPPAGEAAAAPAAAPPEPERGRLAGDVVVRLFERTDTEIDPETEPALLVFRTDTLDFNAVTGELSTTDEISVRTPDLQYRGRNLLGKFDDVRQRFFVRVKEQHWLQYTQRSDAQRAAEPAEAPSQPPAPVAAAAEGAAPAPAARAPKIDLYRCVVVGDLVLQQVGQGRRLTADKLELWARLEDGKLPEGAVAPLEFGEADGDRAEPSATAEVAAEPEPAGDSLPAFSEAPPDAPNVVTMTWTGELVLTPLDAAPGELEADDAAMRFTAIRGNHVVLTDDGDANLRCAMLHYGATTRRVTLSNRAPGEAGASINEVVAEAFRYGALRGPVIKADLATGLGSIEGPGNAQANGPEAGSARRLSWSERADFTFRTADGRVTGAIEQAVITGDVRATDGRARLSADSLRADFVPGPPGEDGRRQDRLARLIADGSVVADGGVDSDGRAVGSIEAAHLDVEFDPEAPGEDPTPRVVDAGGAPGAPVVTKRPGERLTCGRLLANMERDDEGRVIVTTVTGEQDVSFTRDDGISADADRMEADARAQVADLFGGVTLSRDGAKVTGEQVRVGGEDRAIQVFGPGTFAYAADESPQAPEEDRLTVTWTTEMRFNDGSGTIDCVGDVVATNRPNAMETDVLLANRVLITLADEGAASVQSDAGEGSLVLEGRRVERMEAIGQSLEVTGGAMASAELRRYVPDPEAEGGRRIERFARLKGDRIIASEVDGTLLVPGPGDAVLYDGRELQEEGLTEVRAGLLPPPSQIRGGTLFRWEGSLTGDRKQGTLVMRREVEMAHQPPPGSDQPEVLLVAEELQTQIDEPPPTASAEGEARISQIRARGAVYVRADRPDSSAARQELIADELLYDAATGRLRASAREGNRVTLFDVARGVPIVARVLEWDLVRDEISIKEMSPVSAPR